ncbi:MAG TPA: hypothetical protein VLI41_05880 [Phenylobacterium sp.]|uniref:hypothetical protein n=1 Tax=Phenylobacterium sp. TaxID=1871053 RepID=UPI002BDFBE6E|nr:hypothetical protein [Phenylobacterium sp.]HSV02717.1 hypothetical protein [Phenylobacterium sp.]
MNLKRTVLAATIGALACGAAVTSASAETRWEYNHPRQDQVLDRSQHQRAVIRHEEATGRISHRRAQVLLAKERRLAMTEHRMARRNGGYLTAAQQHRLVRQETRLGHKIRG